VLINRRTGIQRHLHSTAAGKAILAEMPEQRVMDIISEHELPAETEHTITDPDSLVEELDEIREHGIAYNDEESVEGLRAVGVPVRGSNGIAIGALSVSGPSNRLRGRSSERRSRTSCSGTQTRSNSTSDIRRRRSARPHMFIRACSVSVPDARRD